jgi:hypothetical protein
MAREEKTGGDKGKVRVRVIDFEMEGNNQTLRESIRDIVGAIGRGGNQIVRAVQHTGIAAPKPNQSDGAIDSGTTEELIDASQRDDTDALIGEDSSTVTQARARKPKKGRALKVVDIDLTSGAVPLKTYLEKAPDALERRYLLIANWLKKYRQIEVVTAEHIYTAYMAMGWTTLPSDPVKPFRNAKEDGVFEKADGNGSYKLTHIGDMKALELEKKMQSGE